MNPFLARLAWRLAGGAFGREYLAELDRASARETWSHTRIEEYRWSRLTTLTRSAIENTPFYRELYGDIELRDEDDFRRLPVLDRDQVRSRIEDMISRTADTRRLVLSRTGGSTGEPLSFYDSLAEKARQKAMIARSRSWAGFREGERLAVVWGAARDMPTQSLKTRHFWNQRWLNAYRLDEERLQAFATELKSWRPRLLLGYAGSVTALARVIRKRGITGVAPAAIETSAERLWKHQRELIEETFQCPVFDSYGSREVSNIAFECERHLGLHVLSDNVHLEVLGQDGAPVAPGEVGEVVVTKLGHEAMPLIRYRNGDLARVSGRECPCGRPFPLLEEIIGRSNDVLRTRDGGSVHGAFFNHLLFSVDGLRQFQVRQVELDRLRVLYRRARALTPEETVSLREKIAVQFGPEVEVAFEPVEHIEPAPSGKHRYVVCEVKQDS